MRHEANEIASDPERGEAAEGESNRNLHIVVGIVCLLLLLAAIYLVFLAVDSSRDDSGGNEDGEDNDGNHGAYKTPPISLRLPPPDPPTPPNGSSDSPQQNLRLPPTDPPTPPPEPKSPYLLACTVGQMAVLPLMLPEDGLCDIVFYTDMFFNSQNNNIEPVYGNTTFQLVRDRIKSFSTTTFGLSMYPGSVGQFVSTKKKEMNASLNSLFLEGWMHFGMLHVQNILEYDELKNGPLKFLEVASEYLSTQSTLPQHHVALGIGVRDTVYADYLLDKADSVVTDFPAISMIILKVHLDMTIYRSKINPLPPNPDSVDFHKRNFVSLVSLGHQAPKRLANLASQKNRYALLSFAMYGRGYRMKAGWNDVTARDLAEYSINTEYRLTCKEPSQPDYNDPDSTAVGNTTLLFLAVFDNVKNIQDKMSARKTTMPAQRGGIMAYRVDMDDWDGFCGEGKFPRLKAMKAELGQVTRLHPGTPPSPEVRRHVLSAPLARHLDLFVFLALLRNRNERFSLLAR
ncbi:hypothetical protein MTO96_038007 [Rhipicephalus appendiculatus]